MPVFCTCLSWYEHDQFFPAARGTVKNVFVFKLCLDIVIRGGSLETNNRLQFAAGILTFLGSQKNEAPSEPWALTIFSTIV